MRLKVFVSYTHYNYANYVNYANYLIGQMFPELNLVIG